MEILLHFDRIDENEPKEGMKRVTDSWFEVVRVPRLCVREVTN